MIEEELIKKAQKGKAEAFGSIYDAYLPKIYRFVFIKTTSRETAEDITHQAFLKAWQNIKSYKPKGCPFGSWLYRIAHNLVIDHYRKARPHLSLDLIAEEELSFEPEYALDQKQAVKDLKRLVNRLPADQQSVVIMKFIEDMTNKEIAAALDKNETTVRVLQHRALKNLKLLSYENNGKQNNQPA